MTDPLLAWRKEFPILETCTYLVSHSLGAMPRRTATYLQQFADEWSTARRARVERRVVGDRADDWRPARAGARRPARDDLDAPERHRRAWRSSPRATRFDGPRNRIVMTDLEFPSNMYLFEGFRRYGADIVYVKSPDAMRTDLQAMLDAIDERTALVPLSYVLFKSAYIQDAAAVIEKAHRVGARVILDVYQAAGTVPLRDRDARRRLRRRRIGEVAVRRARCRLSLRASRPCQRALQPGIVGWAAHAQPFGFADGAIAVRRCAGALPERHAERALALLGAGRVRDRRRRSACRRSGRSHFG